MLTLSSIINEVYVNILIFVYGWTHNAPRIPKIYNITGIWSTDQKLLTVKPIATLRYMKWNEMIWNEMKQEALRRSIYMTTWLTDWLTDWQAAKDVVTFLNNEWRMCQYFNIFIQLNHKCIISFASDEYIPSY